MWLYYVFLLECITFYPKFQKWNFIAGSNGIFDTKISYSRIIRCITEVFSAKDQQVFVQSARDLVVAARISHRVQLTGMLLIHYYVRVPLHWVKGGGGGANTKARSFFLSLPPLNMNNTGNVSSHQKPTSLWDCTQSVRTFTQRVYLNMWTRELRSTVTAAVNYRYVNYTVNWSKHAIIG